MIVFGAFHTSGRIAGDEIQALDVLPDFVVKLPKEALLAEYGSRFGRSNVLRYLGQLKRLGFVREDRANRLYEGPLLDLLVDGRRLASEIEGGVLRDMLGADSATEVRRAVVQELELESVDEDEVEDEDEEEAEVDAEIDEDEDLDDEEDE